jgi:hypothetical protein
MEQQALVALQHLIETLVALMVAVAVQLKKEPV